MGSVSAMWGTKMCCGGDEKQAAPGMDAGSRNGQLGQVYASPEQD